MSYRRGRALICGHIGFDYFIDEMPEFDLKTKEDFFSYIETKDLKPYLGGTAGNVSAIMRSIGSLEVDRFSAGDEMGFKKYDSLSQKCGYEINENITADDCYLTIPICLIFSKDQKQKVCIYDQTLHVYNAIQEFDLTKWGSVSQYELLHITTLPPNAALKLIEECVEKSPKTVRSFCPGQNLKLYHPPVLFKILDNIDILFVNDDEMKLLSEMIMEHSEAFNGFPDIVIHTRGASPTKIITKEKTLYIPTIKPEKVVDTTGAGDSYAAAFLSDYMVYEDLEKAGKYAATVASFIVEKRGCQTNIPSWEQIYERMKTWEEPQFSSGK